MYMCVTTAVVVVVVVALADEDSVHVSFVVVVPIDKSPTMK